MKKNYFKNIRIGGVISKDRAEFLKNERILLNKITSLENLELSLSTIKNEKKNLLKNDIHKKILFLNNEYIKNKIKGVETFSNYFESPIDFTKTKTKSIFNNHDSIKISCRYIKKDNLNKTLNELKNAQHSEYFEEVTKYLKDEFIKSDDLSIFLICCDSDAKHSIILDNLKFDIQKSKSLWSQMFYKDLISDKQNKLSVITELIMGTYFFGFIKFEKISIIKNSTQAKQFELILKKISESGDIFSLKSFMQNNLDFVNISFRIFSSGCFPQNDDVFLFNYKSNEFILKESFFNILNNYFLILRSTDEIGVPIEFRFNEFYSNDILNLS
jgi:hypothetical protein